VRQRWLPGRPGVPLLGLSGVMLLLGTWGGRAQSPTRLAQPVDGPQGTPVAPAPRHDAERAAEESVAAFSTHVVRSSLPDPSSGEPQGLLTGARPSARTVAPGAHPEVAPAPRDDAERATEDALAALSAHVARSSHPEALRTAFQAYFRYREAKAGTVRKPYLYFVDLGLDNLTARGWVFDMEKLELVEGPFTVAHGRGSARQRDGVPSTFSNRPGSKASSLGLYLAQETYTFRGKSGGRAYSSVGLRMRGESGAFNDRARARGIVAHGAPYVTARAAGRSEGCPAMEQRRAARLLPLLAEGGVVFLYSPHDERWLDQDPWAGNARLAGTARGRAG